MTIVEEFAGTNGTWGTEYSLTGSTTGVQTQTGDGLYSPFLNLAAIDRGDRYVLRAYEKVLSGGTQRVCGLWNIEWGTVLAEPLVTLPPLMMLHGWDFTLQRISGSDRTITWNVRGSEGNIAEFASGTRTVDGTEFYLASGSTSKTKQTTAGFYQLWLDCNAIVKGDNMQLQMDEEARAADSTEQLLMHRTIRLAFPPISVFEVPLLMNGWEMSLDMISASSRSVPYSIRSAG